MERPVKQALILSNFFFFLKRRGQRSKQLGRRLITLIFEDRAYTRLHNRDSSRATSDCPRESGQNALSHKENEDSPFRVLFRPLTAPLHHRLCALRGRLLYPDTNGPDKPEQLSSHSRGNLLLDFAFSNQATIAVAQTRLCFPRKCLDLRVLSLLAFSQRCADTRAMSIIPRRLGDNTA
jgi:hypothetical protein